MLDTFMQQLMKEMEIEGSLATEVPGVYAIPIAESGSLFITSVPRGFTLRCQFAFIKPENEETFYTHALQANLFGEGTEGSILGIDSEGKQLILSREIDYNLEYKEFREIIEDFLNSVDFWREEAQAYGTKIE
jgi:hypothetical protein